MRGFLAWVALIAAVVFGLYSCEKSDWYRRDMAEDAAQRHREETPHVIREADGCKVYAFKVGDANHFFTRCGSEVTTERNYTQTCGKNCVKHLSETIVTEGNK